MSNRELVALGKDCIDIGGIFDKVDAEARTDREGLARGRSNRDRVSIGAVNSIYQKLIIYWEYAPVLKHVRRRTGNTLAVEGWTRTPRDVPG